MTCCHISSPGMWAWQCAPFPLTLRIVYLQTPQGGGKTEQEARVQAPTVAVIESYQWWEKWAKNGKVVEDVPSWGVFGRTEMCRLLALGEVPARRRTERSPKLGPWQYPNRNLRSHGRPGFEMRALTKHFAYIIYYITYIYNIYH